MALLELVAIVVDNYDPTIAFFVDALGFELIEDSPSLTNDGRAKRWVVVRPRGALSCSPRPMSTGQTTSWEAGAPVGFAFKNTS